MSKNLSPTPRERLIMYLKEATISLNHALKMPKYISEPTRYEIWSWESNDSCLRGHAVRDYKYETLTLRFVTEDPNLEGYIFKVYAGDCDCNMVLQRVSETEFGAEATIRPYRCNMSSISLEVI